MAIDLHTHSDRSDGSDHPARLIEKAARRGLSAVALTDHDTLSGVDEAKAAAASCGIELIPGIELSCDWEPGTMHMLILFLSPGSGPFQERLDDLERWREERNERIVDRLRELGIDISMDEVLAEAGEEGVAGRPHFAVLLVKKGVVADFAAAFDIYLAKGRPAYVDRPRLTPAEAIRLARASGALPVIAHPHTLGLRAEVLRGALADLASEGLVGLECFYSDYLPEQRLRLAELARVLGLIPTGGSDYHGDYKPWLELGVGQGDLVVPDTVLAELRSLISA